MVLSNEDILKAAFKVWGAQLYQNMSLSLLAKELGITKAALYRHFKNKRLLLEGMADVVFERLSSCIIKSRYTEENKFNLRLIRLIHAIALYFENSRDDFIWTMMSMYGSRDTAFNISEQLKCRGINLSDFYPNGSNYPTELHFAFATLFFMLAQFHKSSLNRELGVLGAKPLGRGVAENRRFEARGETSPPYSQIPTNDSQIEAQILHGLGYQKEQIDALDYGRLEKLALDATLSFNLQEEHNRLLNAVASAMAEAGPCNVSLDQIAKKSGLAKSSLYNYFESKTEMLNVLILKEFGRIAQHGTACSELAGGSLEKLYLSIVGVALYLRMKPDILLIVDKLKTKRPAWLNNCHVKNCLKTVDFTGMFPNIEAGGCLKGREFNEWVLFLIADLLQRRPESLSYADISDESFRLLFGFITRGIDNINNEEGTKRYIKGIK